MPLAGPSGSPSLLVTLMRGLKGLPPAPALLQACHLQHCKCKPHMPFRFQGCASSWRHRTALPPSGLPASSLMEMAVPPGDSCLALMGLHDSFHALGLSACSQCLCTTPLSELGSHSPAASDAFVAFRVVREAAAAFLSFLSTAV